MFRRLHLKYFWLKLPESSFFCLVHFRLQINVLIQRGWVGNVPDSPTSHMGSCNTGIFKTSCFHFSMRLHLLGDIFTQNIFLICWTDFALKALSLNMKNRRWLKRLNNEWLFSSLIINIFLYTHKLNKKNIINSWTRNAHI